MDSYKEWEVVSGPDETPLRVHKALSHLGLDISLFQGSQFFRIFKTFLGIFKTFFVNWALIFEFVLVWIYVIVDFVTYLISKQ